LYAMNVCNYHINPVAVVALVAGYALLMVMRRVLGEPIFGWWDVCVLSFIVLLAFDYQARPEELHHVTVTGGLVRAVLNYLYRFVVVCSESLRLPTIA